MSTKGHLVFKQDQNVLCFHGPLLYEAKILAAEWWEGREDAEDGPYYLVHYKGWKQRWDEWVQETRVMAINEENLRKQRALKQSYRTKKAPTRGATASRHEKQSSTEEKGKKRPREDEPVDEEEEYMARPEVRIPIPSPLKVRLVDDFEWVTRQHKLVPLPRTPSVNQIIDMYCESREKKRTGDSQLTEFAAGLRAYFDRALGNRLLYRLERQQYAQILKEQPNAIVSDVYGAEHLLRLFVELPKLLAFTSLGKEDMTRLREQLLDLLKYMQKHAKQLFTDAYENASPAHMNMLKAM
ncbi:MRG-domain-containing protein [Thamnocephalis sphaerospora]|uniref:Chromatin modification-related protein EAF3 n=1 Tax=Thamnocephalis sphaerospora TaxID=78915 RepID=A0A4P9XLR5_9FUNG|nr:MRG-domain-containing protein [Thamnocephalis sphaerospora]|eukprot:RKP06762.1 MRG-domain-containing protein [Thamnocephalis sphaerospora]